MMVGYMRPLVGRDRVVGHPPAADPVVPPAKADAGFNAAAMGVLGHTRLLAGGDDPAAVVDDVVRNGAATNGHPRALVDATACAYTVWSLAPWNRTLRFVEVRDLLIDEHRGWGAFPDMERLASGGFVTASRGFVTASRVLTEPYERLRERTDEGRTG